MSDRVTNVGADQYPFYDNEAVAVQSRSKGYGFDSNTSNMYRAVTAAKVAPNKLVTTNRNGQFPLSSIPQLPYAVTNRAQTILYKLYVENDGALSYDSSVGYSPTISQVTNRAGTVTYRLYIEDNGIISYDVASLSVGFVYVTNRAGTTYYRIYVEDDGALSYDVI